MQKLSISYLALFLFSTTTTLFATSTKREKFVISNDESESGKKARTTVTIDKKNTSVTSTKKWCHQCLASTAKSKSTTSTTPTTTTTATKGLCRKV